MPKLADMELLNNPAFDIQGLRVAESRLSAKDEAGVPLE